MVKCCLGTKTFGKYELMGDVMSPLSEAQTKQKIYFLEFLNEYMTKPRIVVLLYKNNKSM